MPVWTLCEDADRLAQQACLRVTRAACSAIVSRGRFDIVLAGGTTPALCYHRLAETEADWGRWHVYFGDERCLPAEDRRRNSVIAAAALFDRCAIPGRQIHLIPAELGAEEAARRYQACITTVPRFDLVLLGLGEDGHTASLFPGGDASGRDGVIAVHGAPKPPPERVSLSAAALSNNRQVLFLVAGEQKRDAVLRWRRGEALPAASIRSRGGIEVLVDRYAWGGCPPSRNPGRYPLS